MRAQWGHHVFWEARSRAQRRETMESMERFRVCLMGWELEDREQGPRWPCTWEAKLTSLALCLLTPLSSESACVQVRQEEEDMKVQAVIRKEKLLFTA